MARLDSKRGIAFIGGGNMAEALITGLLEAGAAPGDLCVAEPLTVRRRHLAKRYRVRVTDSNVEAAAAAGFVVLAVKPQVMAPVLDGLRGRLKRRAVVISIAAGVKIKTLERGLGGKARVVRVMPNTPALVGRGASVVCAGTHATAADLRNAGALFTTVGHAYVIESERHMDAVTGLSGSGPAYVYAFAEALIKGGTGCGLDPALATELVYETLAGAAEMMIRTGRPPAELRQAVTSPGGTTLAGLTSLGQDGFDKAVVAAVKAATKRSRELGRG